MKPTAWFKGLKYAEDIGAAGALHLLMTNEIDHGEFRDGMEDYISHASRLRTIADTRSPDNLGE